MTSQSRYGYAALLALVTALVAFWLSQAPEEATLEPVRGRNNSVLFIASEPHGLSNVHMATAHALLEQHPLAKIHYASFPKVAGRIRRTSSLAPAAEPIAFHPLEGRSYSEASPLSEGVGSEIMVHPPGLASAKGFCFVVENGLSPWSTDEYYALYMSIRKLIEDVDPAIIVLDMLLNPAVDAARDMNRAHAILTPNVLSGIAPATEKSLSLLWKYPATASGYPFPVPWRLIPANIYLNIEIMRCMFSTIGAGGRKDALKSKGIKNPLDFMGLYKPHVPWITQTLPGAHVKLDHVPSNIVSTGPINFAGVGEDDEKSELVNWVKRAPTVVIVLGSHYIYTEQQARSMMDAIQQVLRQTEVQVLWKVNLAEGVDVTFLRAVNSSLSDRFRAEKWLDVEPPSLLLLDTVVASVHHGGAGGFHDALGGGVPQIILPLWIDLYDFAQLVEYLGIGVWACQETSPDWSSECLASAFLEVLASNGEEDSMKQRARVFGDQAKKRPGRYAAAEEVAKLAALGH